LYSIETNSLLKEFGKVKAVDNISFKVEEKEIFGFLGPNGAGKSTTMMILTTLLKPTSGKALVAGFDVLTQAKKVRENIGYVQQETTVDEFLTGRENLTLQARLNQMPKNIAEKRIDEILELIELSDKQNQPVVTYSGGMRKRLDIAGGLLHMPKILFLDEPTVGLDIQTRRKIWEYLKKIHDEFQMTIFLSTHYMEEADKLCDRIGIIDYGQIQVIDSPQAMKDSLGKEHSVWLKVVMFNDKLYFSRHRPDSDWFKNAFANSEVRVQYDNQSVKGNALFVTDESLAKKISQLKYPGEQRADEKRVVLEVTLYEQP